MTLNPLKSPVLFSGLFAWLVGLVASCLPIWKTYFLIEWRPGVVKMGTVADTLWEVLKWRSESFGPKSSFPGLLQEDVHNLALGFAILACSAIVGRLCYWLLRERGQPITSGHGRGPR
jgi:hypothetical protein